MSLTKRVREYCELCSLVNFETHQFFPLEYYESGDPPLTKKFSDWNLNNVEEWDIAVEKETLWILENKNKVLSVLPNIQKKWPYMCKEIKNMYKNNK